MDTVFNRVWASLATRVIPTDHSKRPPTDIVYQCDRDEVTHRFLVTLRNGGKKREVDLHLDSDSSVEINKAIRAVYPPGWEVRESILKWKDDI